MKVTKRELYSIVRKILTPKEVARFYLGTEDRTSGDSIVYYSPMREKENTPSFFVDDEKGIHDFGTGVHYNIISFVEELFGIDCWSATKKLCVDFKLKMSDILRQREKNHEQHKSKTVVKQFRVTRGDIPSSIACYFDDEEYTEKPLEEVAYIKNRIDENNFTYYRSIEEIAQEIIRGKTCVPSAIKGNVKQNWLQQQVFLIDFDNKQEGKDLTIADSNHVTEEDVLEYCKHNNILPTIIYNTFSHTEKQHKFRLVFVFEEPVTNLKIAKQIPLWLLKKFEKFNPDVSKKNLSDMYFGGRSIYYIGNNFYKVEADK